MQVSHSDSGSGSGILRDSLRGNISFVFSLFDLGCCLGFGFGLTGASCRWWVSSSAAVGLSRRPDAGRQSPGEGGIC